MQQVSTAAQAILTATARASITPADLLIVAANSLAEARCSCHDLPADSPTMCRACREAAYLSKIAASVDLSEAVTAITEAAHNTGADLVDLLPLIVEGLLDHSAGACTCDSTTMCPTCSAARDLDRVQLSLAA